MLRFHKEMYVAGTVLLIFTLVGWSSSEPTLAPTEKTFLSSNAPNTRVSARTRNSSAKPLVTTVALSTASTSTKEIPESTIKFPTNATTPGALYSTSPPKATAKERTQHSRLPKLLSTLSTARSSVAARTLTKVQEMGALDCDLPLLPRESRLWRGNETHELNLPFTITEDCSSTSTVGDEESPGGCIPEVVSWEASTDIQSGDILIIRISDSLLIDNSPHDGTKNKTANATNDGARVHRSQPQPAVYQVNRLGHEHCDITDGMLLDITPLEEQGDKLITLFDKDLNEGVNLLIVVSATWGSQCVRLKVTVKSDNCGESQECSGKGVCYTNSSMDGYECQCCPGHVGSHCEDRDACDPSPCLNNGICVDITQPLNGANYHCLCPYGFTGRKCEKDPCYSAPCTNGGSCMSMAANGSTTFHCACPEGWMGSRCEVSAAGGACASNPCANGICVETDNDHDGLLYQCYCQPGYTGDKCELEYNECQSSPCANGGTCTDRVGGFDCACGRGYTGNMCQLKVDLCSPNPCPSHRFCIDRGNNYACECPRGYIGEECSALARSACDSNPCAHGGTCWNGIDSFYCSCRPGYTGKLCEDDYIMESVMGGENAESHDNVGGGSVREMHLPLGLYHDRLHNIYIAAGTLGAAIAIVGVVVTACHCRVNKTYSRLMSRLSRTADPTPPHHWLQSRSYSDPANKPMPVPIDTDMYYTLDFSDSQSSPLIQ